MTFSALRLQETANGSLQFHPGSQICRMITVTNPTLLRR
jgi:hypothetical protein